MKPFKIRIVNKDHGNKFQDYMLEKGFDWWSADSKGERRKILPSYICLDKDMKLIGGGDEVDFKSNKFPEKWFYDGELQDNPCVIPDLKIRITDKVQSEYVQNLLMERGIYWAKGLSNLVDTEHGDYLLVREGRMFIGDTQNFEYDDRPEVWFYEGNLWNITKTEPVLNRNNSHNVEPEPQPQPKFYPGKELKTGREILEAQLAGFTVQKRDSEGKWVTYKSSYLCGLDRLDNSLKDKARIKPNHKRYLKSSELAEPLNEKPLVGQKVWTPDLSHDFLTRHFDWSGSIREENLLRRGLIYIRSDEAHKHALATITYEYKEE